jgi:hypothetical protein
LSKMSFFFNISIFSQNVISLAVTYMFLFMIILYLP